MGESLVDIRPNLSLLLSVAAVVKESVETLCSYVACSCASKSVMDILPNLSLLFVVVVADVVSCTLSVGVMRSFVCGFWVGVCLLAGR